MWVWVLFVHKVNVLQTGTISFAPARDNRAAFRVGNGNCIFFRCDISISIVEALNANQVMGKVVHDLARFWDVCRQAG